MRYQVSSSPILSTNWAFSPPLYPQLAREGVTLPGSARASWPLQWGGMATRIRQSVSRQSAAATKSEATNSVSEPTGISHSCTARWSPRTVVRIHTDRASMARVSFAPNAASASAEVPTKPPWSTSQPDCPSLAAASALISQAGSNVVVA